MPLRQVKFPKGYDPRKQKSVGLFAAQLDDQLRLLVDQVKDLSVQQLEWQYKPGMNTIGMLLAHLAVVDVWWAIVAPRGPEAEPESDNVMMRISGIKMDDDGMPLAAGGKHPQTLAGKTASDYLTMLRKARRAVHKELRTWPDTKLEKTFPRRKFEITHTWVLYHMLEHFAGHFGQILLIKHMMRDAGMLVSSTK